MNMLSFIKILNENVETVCEKLKSSYRGKNRTIEHLSKIKNKTSKPDSTLSFIINEEYYDEFLSSTFKVLLVTKETFDKLNVQDDITYIFVNNPKESYYFLINKIYSTDNYQLIDNHVDKSAQIDPSSHLDDNVYIGKNVKIGRNCSILKNTIIEDNVVIGDSCVIGSTGLDSYIGKDGNRILIQSVGGVKIEKNVTIKNFCNVDRGSGGRFTNIQKGALIGSHTHLAHDVVIGRSSLVIEGAVIAGHVKIGSNVTLGLKTSILQNVKINDNAKTGIGTVVTSDVKMGQFVIGNPGRILK